MKETYWLITICYADENMDQNCASLYINRLYENCMGFYRVKEAYEKRKGERRARIENFMQL